MLGTWSSGPRVSVTPSVLGAGSGVHPAPQPEAAFYQHLQVDGLRLQRDREGTAEADRATGRGCAESISVSLAAASAARASCVTASSGGCPRGCWAGRCRPPWPPPAPTRKRCGDGASSRCPWRASCVVSPSAVVSRAGRGARSSSGVVPVTRAKPSVVPISRRVLLASH